MPGKTFFCTDSKEKNLKNKTITCKKYTIKCDRVKLRCRAVKENKNKSISRFISKYEFPTFFRDGLRHHAEVLQEKISAEGADYRMVCQSTKEVGEPGNALADVEKDKEQR